MNEKGDLLFSLDVGTRKVAGILTEIKKDKLHIVDVEWREHEGRSMLDGQIHDVGQVAEITAEIKDALEKRTKTNLTSVAVAVAGRALKTEKAYIELPASLGKELSRDDVLSLELSAVQKALSNIRNKNDENDSIPDFHCVGYSVVSYSIDGTPIGNLVGQDGTKMGVEVLATFLPRIVVDSMFAVMRKVKLEVKNLTLEPISAMEAIIPPTMRGLNIALIDIGAGTSDIAITRGGTVIGYGMVPIGGDEVTEKLCDIHLLDFKVGEKAKKLLTSQEKVEVENILGQKSLLESKSVIDELSPEIENIASRIADEILRLNGTPPQVIVLVGGASQMPNFQEFLARKIGIPQDRIGIRYPHMIHFVEGNMDLLKGPDAVTPIGIAVAAVKGIGLRFRNVVVNQKKIQLLNLDRELNVIDAVSTAGIDVKKLYPTLGMALTITVNGEMKIIKGELGRPAIVKINEREASLDTIVKPDDRISIEFATPGRDAQISIQDLITEDMMLKVTINGREFKVKPAVFMNGERVGYRTMVPDRAKIQITDWCELESALAETGYDLVEMIGSEFDVTINGVKKTLAQMSYTVFINDKEVETHKAIVKNGDKIEHRPGRPLQYRVKELTDLPPSGKDISVVVNGQKVIIKGKKGQIFVNKKEADLDTLVSSGSEITTIDGTTFQPIVSDVFKYISMKIDETQQGNLKILLNGERAGFVSPIKDGDIIEIGFKKEGVS